MKTVLAALLGGALLALGSAAHAQGRSDPSEDADIDCATARNPKGCCREAARETCKKKPADERRACYREALTR